METVRIVFLGITGLLGVAFSFGAEKRYRKAKRALDRVKESEIESIKNALEIAKVQKYEGFVTGKIKSIDSNEVVYTEKYPSKISLFSLIKEKESPSVSSARFELNDNKGGKILVSPRKKAVSFGLHHEDKYHHPLVLIMQGLIFAVGGFLYPSINLGTSEYMAYNGQDITLFGTVSYNQLKECLEMKKIRFLFRGAKRDVEKHLSLIASKNWWNATIIEAITLGFIGALVYQLGKRAVRWFKVRREEGKGQRFEERMAALNIPESQIRDYKCAICYERFKNVIYKNCNHLAVCSNCDRAYNEQICPVCRSPIVSKIIIDIE